MWAHGMSYVQWYILHSLELNHLSLIILNMSALFSHYQIGLHFHLVVSKALFFGPIVFSLHTILLIYIHNAKFPFVWAPWYLSSSQCWWHSDLSILFTLNFFIRSVWHWISSSKYVLLAICKQTDCQCWQNWIFFYLSSHTQNHFTSLNLINFS